MRCLSVRRVAPSLLLVGATLLSALAWPMDEMSDNQLATTTGQDGITVLIAPPKLGAVLATGQTNGLVIGAMLLHDKNGFAGFTSGGALIFGDASQANAANATGVQMGIYASSPIQVVMDASNGQAASGTGGTKPLLNINVGLPGDLLIRTGDISIDASNRNSAANPIAVGATGATAANAAIGGTQGYAYKIMSSIDIALGVATSLNIQLGNTQQGGLLKFSNFNIPSLSLGLNLVSPNGGTVAASNLTASVVMTNLNLTGAVVDAVQDMGLALGGSSTGVGGLILQDAQLGCASTDTTCKTNTPMSMVVNSVTVGTSGVSDGTFGGSKNASMGSFGLTNVSVSNLKIGVSGM
ncbi:MAG: hypothetical protein KGO49_11815 [Gammaproteobacteria bacterium]|nr:hypothetical protein [Gammaproteobacteria bacterium]